MISTKLEKIVIHASKTAVAKDKNNTQEKLFSNADICDTLHACWFFKD